MSFLFQQSSRPAKEEVAESAKDFTDEEETLLASSSGRFHTSAHSSKLRTSVLAAAILLMMPFLWPTLRFSPLGIEEDRPDVSGYCSDANAIPSRASKKNIWKNLDVEEALSVRKWLFADERGLNLTSSVNLTTRDNTVFLIEAHRPSKQSALDYFDKDGNLPLKYAHAVIHHATREKPVIVDYLVGPLPISSQTTMRPLAENYALPEVPLTGRGFLMSDWLEIALYMRSAFGPIEDLTRDLFDAGFSDDTLLAHIAAPASFDGEWRRVWLPLKLNGPGSFLRALDCYVYVDMTALDSSEWKILTIVYNHQVFKSIDEFYNTWKSKTLQRSPKVMVNETDWATRTRKGRKRDLDHLTGPQNVLFDGPRFRADVDEQFITWMGWSFYLGFERDMGLNLWNINFRDERIIFELAPQEAMAQYSGNDPQQSSTVWLDRAFGMGALAKELMVGYDCPSNALYLPSTVHTAMGTSVRLNGICIFEKDTNTPLTRHTGDGKDEMGASKGYELVVRSISSVGNYDYLFDYTFQFDGSLEVRFSASGYLQGNYWDPSRNPYGMRIQRTAAGGLHDHVINYKVDFDIAGVKNSVSTISLEVQEIEQPYLEDWGTTNIQQTVVKTLHQNESTTKFEHAKNGEGMIIITNEDTRNAWGVPRGYAVHPGVSNIHLTNLDNKRTLKNVQWAKKHAFVTRQKDTEPYASSMWNMNLPGSPPVNFDNFFDDESVDQEDLVLWVNLGTHHLPRAEDSPHTLTNLATSYLLLTPFNYNDYDVSTESQNAILMNHADPLNPNEWEMSGHIEPGYCLPKKTSPTRYTGTVGYREDGSPAGPGEVPELGPDYDPVAARSKQIASA